DTMWIPQRIGEMNDSVLVVKARTTEMQIVIGHGRSARCSSLLDARDDTRLRSRRDFVLLELTAMRNPLRRQLLLRSILRQTRAEGRKVDFVDRLVLIEAGKDVAQLAGGRIAMGLQALRANFLHHAL